VASGPLWVDEPTIRAQSLNFLYGQFKAPSMTDSWYACPLAANDHEPLIAHPGSYDANPWVYVHGSRMDRAV
jgi:hypothetical protein